MACTDGLRDYSYHRNQPKDPLDKVKSDDPIYLNTEAELIKIVKENVGLLKVQDVMAKINSKTGVRLKKRLARRIILDLVDRGVFGITLDFKVTYCEDPVPLWP